MNQKITLYHGSEQIIESPTFGLGKQNGLYPLCVTASSIVTVLIQNT